MKKSKLLAVSLLGAVLALAGCGETPSSSEAASSSPAESSTSSSEAKSESSSETTTSSSEEEVSSSSEESSSSSSSSVDEITDQEEILGVLEAGIAKQKSIKSVIYNDPYGDENPYEFGNDKYGEFVKIDSSYQTSYYGHRANGDVYGINYSKSSEQISSAYQVKDECIYGAKVYISPLYQSDVFDGNIYGVEGFLKLAQTYVTEDANKDVTVDESSTETAYSFSFGVVNEDWNKNTVYTVFTYDLTIDATGTITELGVYWSKYTGTSIETDYETNTVRITEDGSPSQAQNFSFVQTVGERTLANPYDIETLYYTSINYKDPDGNDIGEEYSVANGNQLIFTVDSFAPETANANIDQPTITYEGPEWGISTGYYQGKVTIYTYKEGDYTCALKTANTTKNFTLHVTAAVAESVSAVTAYIKEGDTYNTQNVGDEGVSIYAGGSVSLEAAFNPSKADQDFTMELIGDNASDATLTKETIAYYYSSMPVYTFTSSVPGTYQVKVTSASVETVTKTVTIEVKEAPELSSLLAKRYAYATSEPGVGAKMMFDISFTPNSDPTTGSVSISSYNEGTGSIDTNVCSYTYDATTKAFTLTKDGVAFTDVTLSFSGSYKLLATVGSGDEAVTTALTEFDLKTILNQISGVWSGLTSNEAELKLTFNNYSNNSTVDFALSKIDYTTYMPEINAYVTEIEYTTSETDDGYVVTLSDEALANIASGDEELGGDPCLGGLTSIIIAKDFKKIDVTLTINGASETVECTWSRW